MGDYLPKELAEKGYVPRGAKKDTGAEDNAVVGGENNTGVLQMFLPEMKWALEIPAKGFELEEFEMSQDGKSLRIFAVNDRTGMVMSVFMEKTKINGNSRDARKLYWDRGTKAGNFVSDEEVRKSEHGGLALVEYIIKEYKGVPVKQKNIYAYFAKNNIWGYIHLSKVQYAPEHQRLFDATLNAARFIDNFTPSSIEYFAYATYFYYRQNYTGAIAYYAKALDLMKKGARPNTEIWIITVDHLGISYGVTGDLQRAREVFEYGLSEEPTYPMFYYNLACTHAEMGDLEKTVQYLGKTYQYKDNMLRGEKIPDPLSDSSFERFAKNDKFMEAARKLSMK